jgi:hypothetical protein
MAISASNFQSNSLSGTVTISNGFANILLPTIPYALEGNKTFVIKLRSGSINGTVLATSPTFTLQDTSSLVSLTANTATVNEGSSVTFTLTMANTANGTNLYYSLGGGTNNQDWTSANAGIVTINNNVGTFTLTANADSLSEAAETYQIQLRTNSVTGNIVYNSTSYTVADTSNAEISASGGNNIFTFAGYKYHVFLSSNNFVVTGNPAGVEVFAVAGGGAGAVAQTSPVSPTWYGTGGGGAGGLLVTPLTLSGTTTIAIGAGGSTAVANGAGTPGSNTTVSGSLTAVGGGGGGRDGSGRPGGSGGGGGGYNAYPNGPGYGYPSPAPTFYTSTGAQGYPGGNGAFSNPSNGGGGGGGGAGGAGGNGTIPAGAGPGGIGYALTWLGMPTSYGTSGPAPGRYFAGGGGAGNNSNSNNGSPGGAGGGGGVAANAIVNTGGGGGGHGNDAADQNGWGGSGIAIIRYPIFTSPLTTLEYLVVAGGGGGGYYGGGGGAGGFTTSSISITPGTPYTVIVGAGGIAGLGGSSIVSTYAAPGANSSISGSGLSTVTAVGGGRGEPGTAPGAATAPAGPGGSGGGGWGGNPTSFGTGYNYPGPTQQGYPGGGGQGAAGDYAGGGGGAGASGNPGAPSSSPTRGSGGNGLTSSITGSSVYYAGGGGGGGWVRGFHAVAFRLCDGRWVSGLVF